MVSKTGGDDHHRKETKGKHPANNVVQLKPSKTTANKAVASKTQASLGISDESGAFSPRFDAPVDNKKVSHKAEATEDPPIKKVALVGLLVSPPLTMEAIALPKTMFISTPSWKL